MKLSNIIKGMNGVEIVDFKDVNISCITHKSKDVIEDTIYFAINGESYKGLDFVEEAIKKGAKVIVSDQKVDYKVTNIIVDDVRVAMAIMAKNFYGRCDEKLKKIAIVGTNGKTTSSYVIANILRHNDKKVGVIGTNGIYINDLFIPSNLTTPDPIELHYAFSQMVLFGVDFVVMEVSAHAIYYNKIFGINFDVALFTNISNEHLDFFGDMDNYAKVKTSLFDKSYIKECVVNVDDLYGVKIAKQANVAVVSYGIYNPSNIFAVDIRMSINGSKFVVNINDEILEVNCKLIGEYNVYNILGSIGVAKLLGVANKVIEKSLQKQKNVPGRFNVFSLKLNKKIIVDFAHTPDGFDKVLSLIRKLRRGRIILVFGVVGYSDKLKRMEMGKIANNYSDKIVITTDNIGSESFEKTIKDVSTYIDKSKIIDCIYDRESAIKLAYRCMDKNDTLVLLGKGVETKQVVGTKVEEYSDIDVVNKCIVSEDEGD